MGQLEVLEWLKKHKKGVAEEMAKDLDMTKSRIFQSIKRLEEKNMLEVNRHVGSDRKMIYELVSCDG